MNSIILILFNEISYEYSRTQGHMQMRCIQTYANEQILVRRQIQHICMRVCKYMQSSHIMQIKSPYSYLLFFKLIYHYIS